MKKTIWIVIIVLIVIAGAWFLHTKTHPALQSSNPIKIGAVISLSGAAASYGETSKNAIHLAVADINASGGINGRPVQVSIQDDHTDATTAVSAFQKLTALDGVTGVVGGLFDFVTKPLFPVADAAKIALITPDNLRIPGGFELTENTFVMNPDFSKVIVQLKGYLASSDTKKLAIVHFKSTFAQEIVTTLTGVMSDLGHPGIIDEPYDQIGGNDFRTTILKLKQEGADTVFLDMVDVDPVNFLTRARELDYHPRIISYHGLYDSFNVPGADTTLVEGAVILDWESSSEKFSAEYMKAYGVEPLHSAEKSYEAVYALAEAIAATSDHSQVAPYLATHTMQTPSGDLVFNKDHALDNTLVKVEVVKSGMLVPLQ